MNMYEKKYGFSLIEILIAMLISSVLMLSLYQIYRQVQRAVLSIHRVIDIDTPLTSMHDRLEIDLTGAIVPASYMLDVKKLLDKETNEKNDKQAAEKPDESIKKLTDVFTYTAADKNFKLTFLTTGGIQSIDTSLDDGKAYVALKPYIKRVFYSLEPDQNNPGLFSLMWGQTDNLTLTLADISKVTQYELAWGIKELSMTFFVYEMPKDAESKGKPALIMLKSFDSKEIFEKFKTYIPAFVTVKGEMVDQTEVRNQEFTFEFSIPSYVIPQKEKNEADSEKKKETKKEPEAEKISPNTPPKPVNQAAPKNNKAPQNNKNPFVKM